MTRNKKWQKRQNRRYEDEHNPLRKMTLKQQLDHTRSLNHVKKRAQQQRNTGRSGWNTTNFPN